MAQFFNSLNRKTTTLNSNQDFVSPKFDHTDGETLRAE